MPLWHTFEKYKFADTFLVRDNKIIHNNNDMVLEKSPGHSKLWKK